MTIGITNQKLVHEVEFGQFANTNLLDWPLGT